MLTCDCMAGDAPCGGANNSTSTRAESEGARTKHNQKRRIAAAAIERWDSAMDLEGKRAM